MSQNCLLLTSRSLAIFDCLLMADTDYSFRARFALNSSLGANPVGNFYLRTKAEAEAGIRNNNYPSFTIVRPSLIDAVREELRIGEKIGLIIVQIFRPLISLRYQAVKAERIALALLDGVFIGQFGECIIESEQLQNKKTSNEE